MTNKNFTSDEAKVSYGFGLQFGQQLLKNNFDGLDASAVAAGMEDILKENAVQISENELNQAFSNIQKKIEQQNAENAKKMKELSLSFLQENLKREGVQSTESGIQYEILEAGTGALPTKDATVKVHYHGTFIDGQVFDSSIERNEPATFGVTQVISGWTEALQLMPVGSKWRITLPSDLAYGDAGSPPAIPGGAVLVFEIHLLSIE